MKTIKYLLVAVLFGTFLISCETESLEEIAADNTALLEFDLQSKTSTGIVQNDPTADTGGDDDIPDPEGGGGSTGGDDDIPDPEGGGSTGGDDDIPDPDGGGSTGGDDDIPDPDKGGSTGGDDDIPDPKA